MQDVDNILPKSNRTFDVEQWLCKRDPTDKNVHALICVQFAVLIDLSLTCEEPADYHNYRLGVLLLLLKSKTMSSVNFKNINEAK